MKSLYTALILLISSNCFSQSISPERVTHVKNCTVRILVDTIPVGTGFIVNDKSCVLTCWHVASLCIIKNASGQISGFRNLYIENQAGVKTKMGIANYFLQLGNANAVAYDFCLIVPIAPFTFFQTDFLRIGNFNDLNDGDEVYTCGYPLGIPQQFISKGIVSTKYTDKTNAISFANGNKGILPREQALIDMTMNRGNSGGAIIKFGATADKDEVVGIADFIISPIGSLADQLLTDLRNGSGGVTISGIDPNATMASLTQILSNTSIGVSGCVSINYFLSELVNLNH